MNKTSKEISRRKFLRGALGAAAVAALPRSLYAGTMPLNLDKALSLHNLHTEEKITNSWLIIVIGFSILNQSNWSLLN